MSQLLPRGISVSGGSNPTRSATLSTCYMNDIRRERQLDGIAKAKERGVRFGVQPKLTETVVKEIRKLRRSETVPEIMRHTGLSKASVYRALSRT